MENASCKNQRPPEGDVEFFEELCLEFSQMLYDISEENNRAYCRLLAQNRELEALCREYEKNQGSISTAVKIRLRQGRAACGRVVKGTLKRIARKVFGIGKRLVIRLGIKDRIKGTKLFHTLDARGVIGKLRG